RIAKILGSPDRQARTAAYAYLLNPFAIVVSAIWGVNDPIPVFLSVLGLYFLLRPSDRHLFLGSFVVGLGIATKLYPILLVPIALALAKGFVRKVKVLAVAAIAPLVTSLPFLLSDARAYLGTAFGFAGGTSGLNRGQLDPQFTIWLFLDYAFGPLDSRLAFVALAGLAIGLLTAYRLVQTHRLDPISAAGLLMFRHPALGVARPDKTASANRPVDPPPPIRSPARVQIVGLVLSFLFVGAFVASTTYQLGHARAVSPSDFARFDVLPDGSFSMRDDFRADILSFYWIFQGTGRYSLHPNGTTGILLDTIDSNGT